MERINTTASYEAYAFKKKPASLNETANLQNSSDSLNPQSFKSEESFAEPSPAKSSMDQLFKRREGGIWMLNSLIRKGELNPEQFNAPDAKNFAMKLLGMGKPGVLLLAGLMNDNKLPNLELSTYDAVMVVNALFGCGTEGLSHLANLINGKKLPDFLPGYDSSESKRIACALLSWGPSGLAVVKALVAKGKLKPEQFQAQDAKEFANALLKCDEDGRAYLADLINKGKLQNLELPGKARTKASQFEELHSTFERGITKAFLGETSNVDDRSWEAIRSQLGSLTLARARGIWQTIANEVAASCFGTNGEVDSDRLKGLMAFLGNEKFFKNPPCCLIPNVELMRSQMYTVCESLLKNRNQALKLLNAAKGIRVGQHGQAILATMSNGRTSSQKPAIAILSSLFTPHRQRYLPTCTIDSLINAEIRNHPERLIKMYRQMLEGEQFTLPSGYAIPQQKIAGGFITVDLSNGGAGREAIFRDITTGDPNKIKNQKDRWLEEGIKYIGSSNQADKYKLNLPVHNMNDILFANFFQASRFGNMRIIEDRSNFGTMFLYTGHKEYFEMYASGIDVGGSNFSNGIAELKRHAEIQRQLGNHYMRMATIAKDKVIVGGNDHSCHAENIDINALLALDLNNMKIGKAYPIGDRNWSGSNASYDIPRLVIRKVNNTPTYEFGTLRYGSQFEKINMEGFLVYTTDIQKLPIKP